MLNDSSSSLGIELVETFKQSSTLNAETNNWLAVLFEKRELGSFLCLFELDSAVKTSQAQAYFELGKSQAL